MRAGPALVVAMLALLAGCQTPPPSAYVRGSGGQEQQPVAQLQLGTNSAGETCTGETIAGADGSKGADIYCGSWRQPSATISSVPGASAADLAATATAGAWRSGIDARMQCEAPVSTTILGGQPALLLQCARRIGG